MFDKKYSRDVQRNIDYDSDIDCIVDPFEGCRNCEYCLINLEED